MSKFTTGRIKLRIKVSAVIHSLRKSSTVAGIMSHLGLALLSLGLRLRASQVTLSAAGLFLVSSPRGILDAILTRRICDCPKCEKAFLNPEALEEHLSKVHKCCESAASVYRVHLVG